MDILKNPYRGRGLGADAGLAAGDVCTDARAAQALFAQCPVADTTALTMLPDLAATLGIASLAVKDERTRMGLGSFKALGAAFAIAKQAAARGAPGPDTLAGETFVCSSAGNHGLSIAAGARVFGASAVIYLAETVPESFAVRLRDKGATVVRDGAIYEDSLAAAMKAADDNGWTLLSDSSWPGYSALTRDIMEGYLIMGAEAARQIDAVPTHLFLQAGVGGMATGCAAAARAAWGDAPQIWVVEPDRAPALIDSIRAGKPVTATGDVSNMGRLDCKEPSHLALKYLAEQADGFVTVTDEQASDTVATLARAGIGTSPSAAAGLAALLHAPDRTALGITPDSRVLIYISEGPAE